MADPNFETLLGAIHGVKTSVEELRPLKASVDELRQNVAELRQNVDGLREELTRTRVDVMDRIDRLQDEVTALRDEAFVTFSRAERVERVSRDTTSGLSAELSGMHRQIRRLQEEVRTLRGEH